MAFGILVVGMLMGILAAIAVVPSDAGLLLAAASYVAVGCLTCVTVIFVAMLSEPQDDREFD